MNKTFWNSIVGPIVGLSPMDGVTDAAMRFVAKKYGQPDIIYTEFVSAEGLWRIKKRGDLEHRIWNELKYSEIERPVIAQIFGSDPESFYEAAKIVCDLGFDGIDINMGCPSPGLEKRGGGAGLIRNKSNAREVIEATRSGVADYVSPCHRVTGKKMEIPVSVKTRIGSEAPDPEWWEVLGEMKLPAVAMHGRTFKQLYAGEANWEALLQAAEVIRESGAKFLGNGDIGRVTCAKLLGNGDVQKVTQCHSDTGENGFVVKLKSGKELDLTGKMDGVLIGRAAMGNPWVLQKVTRLPDGQAQCHSDTQTRKCGDTITLKDRLAAMVEQAKKYEEIFKELKNSRPCLPAGRNQELKTGGRFQFFPMRKHLACFARGFEGSNGLRKKLMTAENADAVEEIVNDFLR